MMKKLLFVLAILVVPALLVAQSDEVVPNENLVAEGIPKIPGAIAEAAGSLASAWTRTSGDCPRTRSRAKLTGMVIAKATSPSSSMRSASWGDFAMATMSKYSEFNSAAPMERA